MAKKTAEPKDSTYHTHSDADFVKRLPPNNGKHYTKIGRFVASFDWAVGKYIATRRRVAEDSVETSYTNRAEELYRDILYFHIRQYKELINSFDAKGNTILHYTFHWMETGFGAEELRSGDEDVLYTATKILGLVQYAIEKGADERSIYCPNIAGHTPMAMCEAQAKGLQGTGSGLETSFSNTLKLMRKFTKPDFTPSVVKLKTFARKARDLDDAIDRLGDLMTNREFTVKVPPDRREK